MVYFSVKYELRLNTNNMRNTVILFSTIFLLFSFLSCKGKQQNTAELGTTVAPSPELIQAVSEEIAPVATESLATEETLKVEPATPILTEVEPLKETKPAPKVQAVEATPKLETKKTNVSSESPKTAPQNEKETEAKVSKSSDRVESIQTLIEPEEEEKVEEVISHDKWDQLVRKYVSASGKVNYKGFKADKANFQAYLDYLSANPPQDSWSRNKIRAYWINAYNAFTVKTIIDNYPLKSITDLGKPWDKSFINIGGKTYSLNDIEHKILRAKYFDSRIHFAVNCASFSCPKILNRAFTESNVSSQMQALAVAYINDTKHNKISPEKAELSQLFEWYKGDFTKKGSLIDYINKYSKIKLNADAEITFMPYNWNLNE